jgi:putative endonuclease
LQNAGLFLFMVTVYVLESLLDQTWYTGMALDARKRLAEHNSGKNRFTKGHRPWKIIYTEDHCDWTAARPREKYLKTAAGKKWLHKKIHGGDTGSLPA